MKETRAQKSKILAIILALLLGGLGVHNFYMGHNTLGLAMAKGARFLLASTSEVYGDPLEHPQSEGYWGNVNPVGPRGVYDEAKRFAEALTMAYRRAHVDLSGTTRCRGRAAAWRRGRWP